MQHFRLVPLLALTACLVSGSGTAGAPSSAAPERSPAVRLETPRAGVVRGRLRVAGRARRYRLVVPEAAREGRRVPLVFAFHGFTHTASGFAASTDLDALAAREGFLLVYPQGRGRRWELGLRRNPDLRFFDRLDASLRAAYPVDEERVYAVGYSQGGAFTNLLAVRRSRRLAATAPHSGFLGNLERSQFRAARPTPLLVIQGQADRVVPPSAGRATRNWFRARGHAVEYLEIPRLGHSWGRAVGIEERIWAFFNGR